MTRRDLLGAVPPLVALNAIASNVSRAADADTASETVSVEARIKHVENGLLPDPPLRHTPVSGTTLAQRMSKHKVPGLSIAVIHDYKIAWVRAYGFVEAGGVNPVTTETLFQAGSISKPVTAVAALRLWDQGKLDLDEDVNRYLKSWKVPTNGGWQPRITVRQLLSHTAGTTVHGFAGYPAGHKIPTLVQVLNGGAPANSDPILVDSVPGIQSRYSGGGYCILQQVLIDLIGKPFPQIMQELVLGPALMSSSSYDQPLAKSRAHRAACGHRTDGEKVPGGSHTYPEMAPAGLWTTSADLARFVLQLQLAAVQGPNAILTEKAASELFSPQVESFQGLGVALRGTGQNLRFEHGGWDEGFVSNFVAYRNRGMGAVIMANSDQGGADIEPEILRSIAKEYAWPEYEETVPSTIELNDSDLHSLIGNYELSAGFRLSLKNEGRRIFLLADRQPAMELFFTSPTAAFTTSVNADVIFSRAEDGAVTGFKLIEEKREFIGKKLN